MNSSITTTKLQTVLFVVLSLFSISNLAAKAADPRSVESADALYRSGQFEEAAKRYAAIATSDPANYSAAFQLGNIALMSNRLDDAVQWFSKAKQIQPHNPSINLPLAELCLRRDDFQHAAAYFRAAGETSEANVLASFKSCTPYEILGTEPSTSIAFETIDPLPLLSMKINDSKEGLFFVDTGAPGVVLDVGFAREVGAKSFGSTKGTFAGGNKSSVEYGTIDSLTLGNFTVKNVPIEMMNTRQFDSLFGGKPVSGIIGTSLLMQFIATIDYPAGHLQLRRKSPDVLRDMESTAKHSAIVPFWMARDHFLVAWGKVNHATPVLLMVDTGSAGGAAKLTLTAAQQAGISLADQPHQEGIGGAGKLKSIPFTFQQLSLGSATQSNVHGWCEETFPWENSLGFRLDGLIGHEFFKPYAVTFDFDNMKIVLEHSNVHP